MTLNFIQCWGSGSRAMESIKWFFYFYYSALEYLYLLGSYLWVKYIYLKIISIG